MGLVIPHMPSRLYPMGASRPRPYDAEVEYLESDGASYIDTGVKINTATDVIKIKFNTIPAGEIPTGQRRSVCGVADSNILYCQIRQNASGKVSYLLPGESNLVANTMYPADGDWHTVELSKTKYVVDSGSAVTINNVIDYTFTRTLHLFALSTVVSGAVTEIGEFKIASFSVTRNGVCILDLIPVRVGTTGYMYDRVSGRLSGNAGSGEFKIGPEKGVVNPYQTDDNALWMMYNGAWNNGVGRFSPTATQIVDCMNNEAPLAAGSVGDDRMWREPTTEYSITPSARLGQMIYDRNFSVMFIGRVAKRTAGAQDVVTFYDGTTRSVGVTCTNANNIRGFLYRNAFNGGDIAPDWNESNEVVFAWLFSFGDSARRWRYRQTDGAATRDYILASDAQLYDQFTPASLKFGYSTKCEIAVAAVYNRAITQTEFEAFWLAAKTQYNLPTT